MLYRKGRSVEKRLVRKRILYACAAALVLAAEICIAKFVQRGFIRWYLGDVLAVLGVWSFVRIFMPEGCKLLPIWVFLFALCIELAQLANVLGVLGIESAFLRTWLGGSFDWKDIVCYAAGCLIAFLIELCLTEKK